MLQHRGHQLRQSGLQQIPKRHTVSDSMTYDSDLAILKETLKGDMARSQLHCY